MSSLPCTGCILDGLLSIEFLDILDAKAEEVRELPEQVDQIAVHDQDASKRARTSAAASISACQAFLPWPSMVAAMSS